MSADVSLVDGTAVAGGVFGGMLAIGLLLLAGRRRGDAHIRSDARAARPRPALLREELAAAGLERMPVPAFAMLSGGLGMLALLSTAGLTRVPVVAAVAGCAATGLPWLLVRARARSRRLAAQAAWPDVVDRLVAAVRSGIALPEAVVGLAAVMPEGSRAPFLRFGREYRATGRFGDGVDALKDALADPIADRILETLRLAREVGGGELVPVLRVLAASLREDAAARAELRARQSWLVNSARLGAVAPWTVLALLLTRPEGAAAYRTPAGAVVIVVAAVLSVIAYRLMIALGRLPQERRWFR